MEKLQHALENNEGKLNMINEMIQNAENLRSNLEESTPIITKLLQQLLTEHISHLEDFQLQKMKKQYSKYIESMNNVKNAWQSQQTQLLKLKQSNIDQVNNKNVSKVITDGIQEITDIVMKARHEMNADEQENEGADDDDDEIMLEFYANNATMKSFLQQILGMVYAMSIHLQLVPSISLLESKYEIDDDNDDDGDGTDCKEHKNNDDGIQILQHIDNSDDGEVIGGNANNEEELIESTESKIFIKYKLYILSDAFQYVDKIENDLLEYGDIQINKEIVKVDTNTINWNEFVLDIGSADISEKIKDMIEMFETVSKLPMDDIFEKIVENAMLKELETAICWELSIEEQYAYKYNMDYIVGPGIIGNTVHKYFPKSMNAKYLRYNKHITNAFIRQIQLLLMDKIIPNSIVELCDAFFRSTTIQNDYLFGCLLIASA